MTNKIAPGTPNIPTKREVMILRPMWNPNTPPTKLMTNNRMPPKTEFNINFKIVLIGKIKILPNRNKKKIQAK